MHEEVGLDIVKPVFHISCNSWINRFKYSEKMRLRFNAYYNTNDNIKQLIITNEHSDL